MIAARLGEDLRLPTARSKEQDAIAMLDEGGVVVLRARAGGGADENAEAIVVFGHAIYEGLVCGGPPVVRAAAYVVEVDAIAAKGEDRVRAADVALAGLLAREAPVSRAELESIVISASSV